MEFDLNLSVVVYPIIEWVKQYSFPKNLSIQQILSKASLTEKCCTKLS